MDARLRSAVGLTLVLALLLFATSAYCSGARDHEDGFFLRLSVGAGMASSETKADAFRGGNRAETIKFEGPSADLNFAIGAMIRPNLALHGTLYGWLISDPDLSIGSSSGSVSGDLDLSAFGAGVTYYFMPSNIYISPSVGFGSMTISEGSLSVESDYGFVGDFTVGKEWWVGDSWGLGVAAGINYHSIPDDSADENWTGLGYAIRFTATMN